MRVHLVAGVVLSCAFATAAADDLGRLFSTPEERARIDNMRAGVVTATEAGDTETVDQLVLNGTLTGSNGKRLAWVNGRPVTADDAGSDTTLLYDGRVRLRWREGAVARDLKPGQVVDKVTGEVFEVYNRPPDKVAVNPEPATGAAEAKD